jgi:hypothetical protein
MTKDDDPQQTRERSEPSAASMQIRIKNKNKPTLDPDLEPRR